MKFIIVSVIVALLSEAQAAKLNHRRLDFFAEDEALLELSAKPENKTEDYVKLDQAAQEDFVRRCEVVVTVSDSDFLPVKPLDRFCETTDAAMECRLKVGMRLKDTHAREGDMGQFCVAVYEWFQGKYGMKCPKQCKKLQCKSTCLWLEAKKKANAEDLEIKEEMQEAEKDLDYVKELGKKRFAKNIQEGKNNFTIKMSKTKVQRAKDLLAREEKDRNTTKAKKDKVDKSVAKLEKAIDDADAKLIQMGDNNTQQQFKLDKNKQTLTAKARSTKRLLDKAAAAKKEEDDFKAEAGKMDEEIKKVKDQKGALEKTRTADRAQAKKEGDVLATKVVALRKAIKELDMYKKKAMLLSTAAGMDSISDEDAEEDAEGDEPWKKEYLEAIHGNYKNNPNVADVKELITNQYNRAMAADKILAATNKKINDTTFDIRALDMDLTDMGKARGKVGKEAADAGKEAKSLLDKATKAQADNKKYKADEVDAVAKKLADMKAAEAKEKASRDKAQKTLKFMEKLQTEQDEKLANANSAVMSAKRSLSTMEQKLKDANAALAKTQKEDKVLADEEKAKKAALKKKETALKKKTEAYKAEARRLALKAPEVVRQHSLEP